MRKLLCFYLIMILSIFSIASAENYQFEFRNGIKFGDSSDDIKNKEKTDFDPYQLADGGWELQYKGLVLSGIGNSRASYFIHANELTFIELDYNYLLTGEQAKTIKEKDYQTIEDGLSRKYPVQIENEIDNMYLNPDGCLWDYVNYPDQQSIVHSTQRIIPLTEHKSLVIQHILGQYSETSYTHRLSYQIVDPTINSQQIVDMDL